MADGAVPTDGQRIAHIGVADRVFLDVRARAHGDPLVIAPERRAEPDAGIGVENHVPGELPVAISEPLRRCL